MKQKKTKIFTACIFAVYIITIALLAASLTLDYLKGETLCEDRFNTLTRGTARAAAVAEPGTELFLDQFKKTVGTLDDIAVLQLTADRDLLFSYPKDVSSSPSSSSFFVRSFSTELSTDSTTLRLSAVIYKLSPRTLFTRFAIAFIIILVTTFIVIIYMICLPAESSAKVKVFTDGNASTPSKQKEEPLFEEEVIDSPVPDTPLADETESLETKGVLTNDTDQTTSLQTEEPLSKETAENTTLQTEAPSGLFSPVTGFGWESYMKIRLESELERASDSDMDLSLVQIKIPGLDFNSSCAKLIANVILEITGFKDLVFENGDDGYTIILQELSIDKALKKAEELYDRIERELAYDGMLTNPAIGLSSRSLRLISADRLVNESSQALKHALDEDGKRIVAFRVNPDKYRNFLLSNQG